MVGFVKMGKKYWGNKSKNKSKNKFLPDAAQGDDKSLLSATNLLLPLAVGTKVLLPGTFLTKEQSQASEMRHPMTPIRGIGEESRL